MQDEIEDYIENDYINNNGVSGKIPLPFYYLVQEEKEGLFDDVYNIYQKPTFKDRITVYPFVFLSFLLLGSLLLLLVNLCGTF